MLVNWRLEQVALLLVSLSPATRQLLLRQEPPVHQGLPMPDYRFLRLEPPKAGYKLLGDTTSNGFGVFLGPPVFEVRISWYPICFL